MNSKNCGTFLVFSSSGLSNVYAIDMVFCWCCVRVDVGGGQRVHVWKPEVDHSSICFSALVFDRDLSESGHAAVAGLTDHWALGVHRCPSAPASTQRSKRRFSRLHHCKCFSPSDMSLTPITILSTQIKTLSGAPQMQDEGNGALFPCLYNNFDSRLHF